MNTILSCFVWKLNCQCLINNTKFQNQSNTLYNVNVNDAILLQECTQSGQGSRRQILEASCYQYRRRQNAASAPPQSSNQVQKHERTVDSSSSSHSLSAQTVQTIPGHGQAELTVKYTVKVLLIIPQNSHACVHTQCYINYIDNYLFQFSFDWTISLELW